MDNVIFFALTLMGGANTNHDGKSKGTKNMIKTMKACGKHGEVIIYEKNLQV